MEPAGWHAPHQQLPLLCLGAIMINGLYLGSAVHTWVLLWSKVCTSDPQSMDECYHDPVFTCDPQSGCYHEMMKFKIQACVHGCLHLWPSKMILMEKLTEKQWPVKISNAWTLKAEKHHTLSCFKYVLLPRMLSILYFLLSIYYVGFFTTF